jgi:hypothetical protein
MAISKPIDQPGVSRRQTRASGDTIPRNGRLRDAGRHPFLAGCYFKAFGHNVTSTRRCRRGKHLAATSAQIDAHSLSIRRSN